MKFRRSLLLALAVGTLCPLALAQPLTSSFTYQGELSDGGAPVNGAYDLTFRLFDAASGGTQFGPTLCSDDLTVTNGKFTVSLDFGNSFPGVRRFIEVQVRSGAAGDCANTSGYTTLLPRQEVTATPYATFAPTAGTATSAVSAANASNLNNQPGSFYQNAANLTGTLADARLSTNVPRLNVANTFVSPVTAPTFNGALNGNASTATLAANASNLNGQPASFFQNASNLNAGTLADARLSTNVPLLSANNGFLGANSFVQNTTFQSAIITEVGRIGSITANPVRLMVNSNTALTLSSGPLASGENGLQFPNIVVGNNTVDPSNQGSGVLSGGSVGAPNRVLTGSDTSVIAGGSSNLASGFTTTISGGYANSTSGTLTVIGGGSFNVASATLATVGGGQGNVASGIGATISGGDSNQAKGSFSTVPGGSANIAGGRFSFAAGQNAVVRDAATTGDAVGDQGSFVWADASSSGTFTTTGTNQFLVRAVGGVGINTNAPEAPLHVTSGSAGLITAEAFSTAVFERGGTNSVSILAPDSASRSLWFGSPASNFHGGVNYTNSLGMTFHSGNAQRIRLDPDGDLGVGSLAPASKLHVLRGPPVLTVANANTTAIFESTTANYVSLIATPGSLEKGLAFGNASEQFHGGIYYIDTDGMTLRTGNNQTRMEINELGNIGVGTAGRSIDARHHVQANAARVMKVDRFTSDGELLTWARDDISIAAVTVAAGVVTYGAFTGVHYATLEAPVETFALVSMTGNNTILGNKDATKTQGETVYGVRASSNPNDPAALGVYMGFIDAEDYNHTTPIAQIAAVGNADMIVVDNGTGEGIAPGDYLISSGVPGAAMKLDPATFPVGHVIAKAAGSVDWSSVSADAQGVKRAKVSVLFTSFTHTDPSLGERLSRLEELLGQK
jgi:hypothetical protein